MQDRILKALIFIVIVAGFLVYSTFFIVKETQQAIVLQLGEPKKV
ncbi:MAG: protease modulator HflC, partial [Candidatus Fonsibacter lacus]|nr:protease modulator HflC [Candidatus Fonsibacter lacus]